jgi:RimJ/RimL family protein N-acetyltransferase
MLIETERLILRHLTEEDLRELLRIHGAPEVTRFMGALDRRKAARWMELNERDWRERGYGRLAIVERGSRRFLGRTGLKYWPQFGETEAGWLLRPDAWGYGFATEAARACLDWGLRNLGLPYVTAMIRPDNSRSLRVADRLGMRPMRDDVLLDEPVVVYSISRGSDEL